MYDFLNKLLIISFNLKLLWNPDFTPYIACYIILIFNVLFLIWLGSKVVCFNSQFSYHIAYHAQCPSSATDI